ncbi:unnamed protein product [Ectocarpus sp. 12 AP-2014]
MVNILRAIVSVFVVTAGSSLKTFRHPETSLETASEPWRVHSGVDIRDSRRVVRGVSLKTTANDGESTRLLQEPHEETSIQPVDRPFILGAGGLLKQRHGIALLALGEPKSGTTWLGRVVPALAIELCGSYNNPWCQLGGLRVHPNVPAPWYDFELFNTTTDGYTDADLFLHFYGGHKHKIPGMHQEQLPAECRNGGRVHIDCFMNLPPCEVDESPTRQRLTSCLWETSPSCVERMTMVGPPVRSLVIMRDPRNVVISEYNMRTDGGENLNAVGNRSLDEFVKLRFQVIVSWMHQRFMWHTGPLMERSSHIEMYEDLQESHVGFIAIAAFMGLECSETQATRVWSAHRQPLRGGSYGTHGLPVETIRSMNTTMARLLPPTLALRWEVQPLDER